MKKRILLLSALVVAIAIGVVGMSAFEAHVINVTAKIENALSVLDEHIEFGTVFPQEYLMHDVEIALSESFITEEDADDVEYMIKQKPKPRPDTDIPQPPIKPDYNMYLPGGPFAGQLYPYFIDNDTARAKYCHDNVPVDPTNPDDLYYINCYPLLCPYLSKHDGDPEDTNDGPEVDAFHGPDAIAFGRLAKSEMDEVDLWTIDLDVPCFEGMCAQDWTHFGWELPPTLESEVFGCDLWFEVTGISRFSNYLCGNYNQDPGEECDDGNNEPNDGCGPTCLLEICGDDIVQLNEECEPPSTTDNSYCFQITEECVGNQTSYRDGYGDCDEFCGCIEDSFGPPECVIGSCGAVCVDDLDCGINETCDSDCQCVPGPA